MPKNKNTDSCDTPPPGWRCTRKKGHPGPCAAVPATKPKSSVFDPEWPEGLKMMTSYKVLCDDKGRKGTSWLNLIIAEDGDVHVSMQDWEECPNGEPTPFPSIRVRTSAGGGRHDRVRQALLWLAEAIRLDCGEDK